MLFRDASRQIGIHLTEKNGQYNKRKTYKETLERACAMKWLYNTRDQNKKNYKCPRLPI